MYLHKLCSNFGPLDDIPERRLGKSKVRVELGGFKLNSGAWAIVCIWFDCMTQTLFSVSVMLLVIKGLSSVLTNFVVEPVVS